MSILDLPEPLRLPFHTGAAGCGAAAISGRTGPPPCQRPAVYSDLRRYPATREAWKAFVCDFHVAQIDSPRPLTESIELG